MAFKYHEHDSLLEQNSDEDLSEEEKQQAWAAYEADVKNRSELFEFVVIDSIEKKEVIFNIHSKSHFMFSFHIFK